MIVANSSISLHINRIEEVMHKLSKLSPWKKEIAITAFNAYLDGMNDQERLTFFESATRDFV